MELLKYFRTTRNSKTGRFYLFELLFSVGIASEYVSSKDNIGMAAFSPRLFYDIATKTPNKKIIYSNAIPFTDDQNVINILVKAVGEISNAHPDGIILFELTYPRDVGEFTIPYLDPLVNAGFKMRRQKINYDFYAMILTRDSKEIIETGKTYTLIK